MGLAPDVAKQLLQIKAIKLSPQKPFTWASGIKSPIYCDNRIALSFPKVRTFLIEAFVKQSDQFPTFNCIAGVATAGIAHGALLANALDLPFVYVRPKAKKHGMLNQIEGKLHGNEQVLVIEDLISTGGSSLKAVASLKDSGVNVVGVQAIFSYGFEEAIKAFSQEKCLLQTLTNYDVLLTEALTLNYINQTDLSTLNDWRSNPRNWKS